MRAKEFYRGGALWWPHDHFLAITVPYRNRLHESKEVGEIYDVSAQITYRVFDGQSKPNEMPRAAWLSEEKSYVDFTRDATHRLIVAIVEGTNSEPPRVYGVMRDSFGSRRGRETRQIELSGDLFGVQISLRSEARSKVVKTSKYMLEIKREPEFDCSLKLTFMWKIDKLAGFGIEATELINKHKQGATDEESEKEFEDWKTKVSSFLITHLGSEYRDRFLSDPFDPTKVGQSVFGRRLIEGLKPKTFLERVIAKVEMLQLFNNEIRNAAMRSHEG